MNDSYCLLTVTDNHFFVGTRIMLHSFFKSNPWWKGDVIIIAENLKPKFRKILLKTPRLKFLPLSDELKENIKITTGSVEKLTHKGTNFHFLEIFNLSQYDWALQIDSDVLCTQSMEEMIKIPGDLLVCGDWAYGHGYNRDKISYKFIKEKDYPKETISNTFNFGIALIRKPLLNSQVCSKLVTKVHPDTWKNVETGHTDQYLANRYLADYAKIISFKFNYNPLQQRFYAENDNLKKKEAVHLHFIGHNKPWHLRSIWNNGRRPFHPRWSIRIWLKNLKEVYPLKWVYQYSIFSMAGIIFSKVKSPK